MREIFNRLLKCFGPQYWWPADTEFEVCIGAILTQNTAWSNVEKAIANLKKENLLSPEAIIKVSDGRLKELIRPAGFYNQKAERLKAFSSFILNGGGIEKLSRLSLYDLREKLLSIKGIGKETADSMILYAFKKPIFVVDAYTKRLLFRLGKIDSEKVDYDVLREMVEVCLPSDAELFGEFHALIVRQCKEFCKKKPSCKDCSLKDMCVFYRKVAAEGSHR
ncbi:endonuclease III domain-containing protein [Desulfurobacterium sp.]|uniref:endonuclease III domain-containing protein n=1 Tax=Desulfurobacterium sp. TaxID=2004706 RepID=UPI0026081987|nr:endonuclease III domain-containing protein [Desulfurobacterium sp.]